MAVTLETRTALFVFGITGLAAILVDVDHALAIFIQVFSPEFTNSRFLHPYIGIIAGMFVLCITAHLGRFYIEQVLRNKNETHSISKSTTDN